MTLKRSNTERQIKTVPYLLLFKSLGFVGLQTLEFGNTVSVKAKKKKLTYKQNISGGEERDRGL